MNVEERTCWLALHKASGVNASICKQLVECFGGVGPIFKASRQALLANGAPPKAVDSLLASDWPQLESELAWLDSSSELGGRRMLVITDTEYPQLLREITDPPIVLFIHGEPKILQTPQLAVVGSRNPTPNGLEAASRFAEQLTQAGLTITSGLALGIDGAAHRRALARHGTTVAVAATGLDRVYPRGHKALAHEIVEAGAIVSEFVPGTPPRAQHFPRRNRIISGLSVGTLVVEAAPRSGSLITARLAMEQGREVFAIPGSINNPQAKGCHALIKQGAKLVENVEDILVELGPLLSVAVADPRPDNAMEQRAQTTPSAANDIQQRLLTAMGYDPITVDTLIRRTGLTAEKVSSTLLILELEGDINAQPGGTYTRSA